MNILRISIIFLIICALIESCTQTPKSPTKKAVVKPAPVGSITKKDTIKPIVITDLKLKRSVDDINHYLAIYDTLSPFGEYNLKTFHIRKKDLNTDDNLSETKGKVSGADLIEYYQGIILNKLNDILYNKHIADYKLEDFFDNQHIAITHSDDGRLYDLVLDEKQVAPIVVNYPLCITGPKMVIFIIIPLRIRAVQVCLILMVMAALLP